MTEQETVAPPSGKRTEVSAPDRRNAATAVELVEPADLEELRRLAESAQLSSMVGGPEWEAF